MPRRVTLPDRQREALLRLPIDQAELCRGTTPSATRILLTSASGVGLTINSASLCNCACCAIQAAFWHRAN